MKKEKLKYEHLDINKPHYCKKCRKYIIATKNETIISHFIADGYKTIQDYFAEYPDAIVFLRNKNVRVFPDRKNAQKNKIRNKNTRNYLTKFSVNDISAQAGKMADRKKSTSKEMPLEIVEFFSQFPDSPLKKTLLFLSDEISKWRKEYEESKVGGGSGNIALLDRIEEKNNRLLIGIEKLRKIHAADKQESDVLELHNKILDECEDYIKRNIGEFSFVAKCQKCDEEWIVDTQGLPHFALVSDNKRIYVWSKQHYALWRANKITLGQMAYLLQTSPINLIETSIARAEYFVTDANKLSAEGLAARHKELILEAEREVDLLRELAGESA